MSSAASAAPPAFDPDATVFDRLAYRPAAAADVPALRELFSATLPTDYPAAFYADLAAALAGAPPPPALAAGGVLSLAAHLADDAGHLAGAAVLAVLDVAAARAGGRLPVELLAAPRAGDAAACVLLAAVGPRYRRLGIGSELLARGLAGAALHDARVRAAFLHARAADAGAAAFYEANDFAPLGALPGHYAAPGGAREDALLWLRPLRGAEAAEYAGPRAPGAGAAHVDLTSPAARAARRMPWWLRDLLCHFVAPSAAVAVLFGIVYVFVSLQGRAAAAPRRGDL